MVNYHSFRATVYLVVKHKTVTVAMLSKPPYPLKQPNIVTPNQCCSRNVQHSRQL